MYRVVHPVVFFAYISMVRPGSASISKSELENLVGKHLIKPATVNKKALIFKIRVIHAYSTYQSQPIFAHILWLHSHFGRILWPRRKVLLHFHFKIDDRIVASLSSIEFHLPSRFAYVWERIQCLHIESWLLPFFAFAVPFLAGVCVGSIFPYRTVTVW
jgi:hypothetical protein